MRVAAATLLLLTCLLGTAVADSDVLDLQPVPELSEQQQQHLRHLMQGEPAAPGGYYGSGRSLLQAGGYAGVGSAQQAGGYGRSLLQAGGYYGNGRRLTEEAPQLEPGDPVLEYAEQRRALHDEAMLAVQQAAGGAPALALRHAQAGHSGSDRHGSGLALPAGQCYCRYDLDFNTWALAEQQCKDALYTRCQTEDGLQCSWLDAFYTPTHRPGHLLPHERDIGSFVFEDCSPQPPCSCSGLKFDGSDAVAGSVACCRDLRVACKTPYSGLCCRKVEAFCSDDTPAPVLAAWTRHVLHHSDCSAYVGAPFNYVTLAEMQDKARAASVAAAAAAQPDNLDEAALLKQALLNLQQQLPEVQQAARRTPTLVTILAAVAAGAVCVAVAAVSFALRRDEGVSPITSTAAAPASSADDVYKALAKAQGGSLAPAGALLRAGSGDRTIAISTLMEQSSMQEPLLQQQPGSQSRPGSISGDNMP